MKVQDETELSEAIAGATGPLRIVGGGTRHLGRDWEGEVLDVSGHSGITLYEPGALTLVVRAGARVSEIEAVLAAEGQRLAFEPWMQGASTIGGVVATNASGSRRIQTGACRDFCLGVRFVDGTGNVVSNGGRVMKNVTGYDLVKLMAGSWGTLGVLSEVSLKVLPLPQMQGKLTVAGLDPAQAVAAMSQALGSPYEVSAATYLAAQSEVWLRVEGFETQVRHRLAQLTEMLGPLGSISHSVDAQADWDPITRLDPVEDAGDLWRVSVRPSAGPGTVAGFPEGARWFMDWGGGLIWVRVPAGHDLRKALCEGHATLMEAPPESHARLGTFQPETAGVAELSAGLRAKFDPRSIFNPGLMG